MDDYQRDAHDALIINWLCDQCYTDLKWVQLLFEEYYPAGNLEALKALLKHLSIAVRSKGNITPTGERIRRELLDERVRAFFKDKKKPRLAKVLDMNEWKEKLWLKKQKEKNGKWL